ncbi:pseudouridine synthase [Fomitopsis betulina]|nr:pseudouridine synthase [Fomitopsis betulina]
MLAGRYLYRAFDSCILIGDTARRSFSLSATVPVIYLDRDVVVINKPHGFKSQYYKQDEDDPTLRSMHEVQALYGLPHKPFGIHRLDKATTGALIWGVTGHSAGKVCQQFEKRQVKKTYLAVVRGAADRFPQSSGTIAGPMRRLSGGSVTTRASPPGLIRKEVVTKTQWELLATSPIAPLSLVRVLPETGFTHQIRVHMAEVLDAPILGDAAYTGTHPTEPDPAVTSAARIPDGLMFLHASELTFFRYRPAGLITHAALTVCAPLPNEFVRLCKGLKLPLPDRYIRGGLDIDGTPVQGPHPVLEDLGGQWMPEPIRTNAADALATNLYDSTHTPSPGQYKALPSST